MEREELFALDVARAPGGDRPAQSHPAKRRPGKGTEPGLEQREARKRFQRFGPEVGQLRSLFPLTGAPYLAPYARSETASRIARLRSCGARPETSGGRPRRRAGARRAMARAARRGRGAARPAEGGQQRNGFAKEGRAGVPREGAGDEGRGGGGEREGGPAGCDRGPVARCVAHAAEPPARDRSRRGDAGAECGSCHPRRPGGGFAGRAAALGNPGFRSSV